MGSVKVGWTTCMPNLSLAAWIPKGTWHQEDVGETTTDLTPPCLTAVLRRPFECDMFVQLALKRFPLLCHQLCHSRAGHARNQDRSLGGTWTLTALRRCSGTSPLLSLSAVSFSNPAMCSPRRLRFCDSTSKDISAANWFISGLLAWKSRAERKDANICAQRNIVLDIPTFVETALLKWKLQTVQTQIDSWVIFPPLPPKAQDLYLRSGSTSSRRQSSQFAERLPYLSGKHQSQWLQMASMEIEECRSSWGFGFASEHLATLGVPELRVRFVSWKLILCEL